jgi:PPOX class probable F420-dependent enzyme
MERSALGFALALVLTLAAPAFASQQAAAPAPPDRAAIVKAAVSVMEGAHYATLVTLGDDGHPQARIVDAFPPDEQMIVWIATTPLTRKVAQIRKDPRVTLSYFDAKTMSYVTLLGRAAIVTDAAEKAKHWKEAWAKLYKDQYRGDDYLLIKVTPLRLEVSAESQGIMNDPKTWRPTIVEFK